MAADGTQAGYFAIADRSLPPRAVFVSIKPIVRREWQRRFAALARMVREDAARAEAAGASSGT